MRKNNYSEHYLKCQTLDIKKTKFPTEKSVLLTWP